MPDPIWTESLSIYAWPIEHLEGIMELPERQTVPQ
jgi:hypothetical protein